VDFALQNPELKVNNLNALNEVTSPPPYPSPLEGEGWERGIINYYVCIS